jgi:hypothetical protein
LEPSGHERREALEPNGVANLYAGNKVPAWAAKEHDRIVRGQSKVCEFLFITALKFALNQNERERFFVGTDSL